MIKQVYLHTKNKWLCQSFTRDFVPRVKDIIRFDKEECAGWYIVTRVAYHPYEDTVVILVEDKGKDHGWPEDFLEKLRS